MKTIFLFLIILITSNSSLATVGQPGFSLTSAFTFYTVERQQDVFAVRNSTVSSSFLLTKLNYSLPNGFTFGASYLTSKGTESRLNVPGVNFGFNF
ncbi:MAG: hypothetical protein MJK18_12755, partial [Bdellovibrionales bacterium]|nr:hypothetical protein [Bdellovibrionales bacterium]